MTCPKCGSIALIRDDDPSNWMEVVACFICGWRLYREVPDHRMKVRDITCVRCGKVFKGLEGEQYCGKCNYGDVRCVICGKVFVSRVARQKYCFECGNYIRSLTFAKRKEFLSALQSQKRQGHGA